MIMMAKHFFFKNSSRSMVFFFNEYLKIINGVFFFYLVLTHLLEKLFLNELNVCDETECRKANLFLLQRTCIRALSSY